MCTAKDHSAILLLYITHLAAAAVHCSLAIDIDDIYQIEIEVLDTSCCTVYIPIPIPHGFSRYASKVLSFQPPPTLSAQTVLWSDILSADFSLTLGDHPLDNEHTIHSDITPASQYIERIVLDSGSSFITLPRQNRFEMTKLTKKVDRNRLRPTETQGTERPTISHPYPPSYRSSTSLHAPIDLPPSRSRSRSPSDPSVPLTNNEKQHDTLGTEGQGERVDENGLTLPPGWTKEDEEAEKEFLKQGMFDWKALMGWRYWIRKEWWGEFQSPCGGLEITR